jgi:A/G-specific adenine glycosylase
MLGSAMLFSGNLLDWYDRHQRPLPWRVAGPAGRLDPYHVLVSETMLQQTQVATVIPYYTRFLELFPTLSDLANAPQQAVLRAWQGLGYYSRARNLQAAAQHVMKQRGGTLPADAPDLQKLPGVGRYTAGAVASIAFGKRAPIVDANVARVLCRLDKITADPRTPAVREQLWARAEEILPRRQIGDFNSALMELGALVCVPRTPRCLHCPVSVHCAAYAAGVQDRIPPAKPAKELPLLRRRTYCITDGRRWLIEQRPATGRWAGMWQFLTIDSAEELSLSVKDTRALGTVTHGLTHRRYEFEVVTCRTDGKSNGATRKWVTLEQIDEFPLPRPHVKIVQMLREKTNSRHATRRASSARRRGRTRNA